MESFLFVIFYLLLPIIMMTNTERKIYMKNFIVLLMFLTAGTGIYYASNISTANTYTQIANVEETTPIQLEVEIPKEEEYGLVNLVELPTNICIELRYANRHNFTGEKI